jgi:hypothetical protein
MADGLLGQRLVGSSTAARVAPLVGGRQRPSLSDAMTGGGEEGLRRVVWTKSRYHLGGSPMLPTQLLFTVW